MSGQSSPTETSPAEIAWTASDLKADPHATPDKAQRVQKMFGAIAASYDLNNRVHSFGRDQAWRRRAVSLCELRPTDEVLDVACGTGDLAQAFAAAGAHTVIGVDFTEEMLEVAREKARKIESRTSNVSYRHADAMNLPFADESFDVVSIAFGIRNVAEPAMALQEFQRVLRRGGRLVVLEFSQPRNSIIRSLNSFYCGVIMPVTATLIARDRSGAYRYLPKSVATFPESEGFMKLLRECGFTNIQQHRMTFGVCTAYLARM